jgi:hypothetical protein
MDRARFGTLRMQFVNKEIPDRLASEARTSSMPSGTGGSSRCSTHRNTGIIIQEGVGEIDRHLVVRFDVVRGSSKRKRTALDWWAGFEKANVSRLL